MVYFVCKLFVFKVNYIIINEEYLMAWRIRRTTGGKIQKFQ